MLSRKMCVALLAVVAMGWAAIESRAGVLYQNTTNPTGGSIVFGGTAQFRDLLSTNVDINELTLAPGSTGLTIDSISFRAYNFNPVAVEVSTLVSIWEGDGPGGGPGSNVQMFGIENSQLAAESETIVTFTEPGRGLIVPDVMNFWFGVSFNNANGQSPITAAELNQLGALTYHPSTVGTDGPQAYFGPPGTFLPDPVVEPLGSAFGANFGWTIDGGIPTPEPASFVLLLIGTPAVAILQIRRRRWSPARR
jgi:hypothetical protein